MNEEPLALRLGRLEAALAIVRRQRADLGDALREKQRRIRTLEEQLAQASAEIRAAEARAQALSDSLVQQAARWQIEVDVAHRKIAHLEHEIARIAGERDGR